MSEDRSDSKCLVARYLASGAICRKGVTKRNYNVIGRKYLTMVCKDCEKKLGRVACPDPWKSGARNTVSGGGRVVGENKALASKKTRFQPYTAKFEKCRICKQTVHQAGSHFCQGCAYKKGICAMCGKKILDVKDYKQSST